MTREQPPAGSSGDGRRADKKKPKKIATGPDCQEDFGVPFLYCTRLRLGRNRKGHWLLTEKRWLCFLPLGSRKTNLRGYYRVTMYRAMSEYAVDVEGDGDSLRIYEGKSFDRAKWLTDTLREVAGMSNTDYAFM
jgi:hypothetical protein